nr:hypothetical protein [uncultured Mediterranean phage uvMED]
MSLVVNKQYVAKDANGKTITADYSFHALNRDETGLLTYSKVNWFESNTIQMDNGEGLAYSSVADFQVNELKKASGSYAVGTNINEIPKAYSSSTDPREPNTKFRKYEQHVFDENNATYFMDANGNIVLRINDSYQYGASQDGETRNWQ